MGSVRWLSVRASIAETLGLQEVSSKISQLKLSSWEEDGIEEVESMGFGQTIDLDLGLGLGLDPQDQDQPPVKDEEAKNGGGVSGAGTVPLKQMIEELECFCHDVPSVFICPISLEPMQDPVTLCTGQTYERSNIVQWFNIGHYICPTTMQELWDVSLTPNRTLFHLIYKWFSHRFLIMKKQAQDVQSRITDLLEKLKKAKGQMRIQTLSSLRLIAETDEAARKTIVDEGGVMLLSSLLGPFTSHLVGAEVIGILVRLPLLLLDSEEAKRSLSEPAKISVMVDLLHEGTIETRINSAKLIEMLVDMEELHYCESLLSSCRLVFGLLKLVKDRRHPRGISAGLSLLNIICSACSTDDMSIRIHMVSMGLVPLLVELLPHTTSTSCLETALAILDTLSTITQGRDALKDCPCTIPNIVRVLMRVSENSKQHALSILWTVCILAPEESTSTAVEAGIATKLLLVIQSSCNPVVKQRSTELLKLCSLNYTATIFISKCNLTRTIQ